VLHPSTIHLITTTFPGNADLTKPPAPARHRRLPRRRISDWIR
jgi:hypothetical protein